MLVKERQSLSPHTLSRYRRRPGYRDRVHYLGPLLARVMGFSKEAKVLILLCYDELAKMY